MDSVLGLRQLAAQLGIDLAMAKRKLRRAGSSADDVLQEALAYAWQRQQAGRPIGGAMAIRRTLKVYGRRKTEKRFQAIESLS